MIYCCIIARKNASASLRRQVVDIRRHEIIHANQNYPGDMEQPLRANLERIEKSVHEVFDLAEFGKVLK